MVRFRVPALNHHHTHTKKIIPPPRLQIISRDADDNKNLPKKVRLWSARAAPLLFNNFTLAKLFRSIPSILVREDKISCKVTLEFGLDFKGLHSSFYFVFCQRIEKSKPLTSHQSKLTGPFLGFWISGLPEICTLQLPPHIPSGLGWGGFGEEGFHNSS